MATEGLDRMRKRDIEGEVGRIERGRGVALVN